MLKSVHNTVSASLYWQVPAKLLVVDTDLKIIEVTKLFLKTLEEKPSAIIL